VLAVADLPAPRHSLEDLRELSRDLEVLVRVVRELAALHAVLDAGLRRPAVGDRAAEVEPPRERGAVA
jgi:hypothetical protein